VGALPFVDEVQPALTSPYLSHEQREIIGKVAALARENFASRASGYDAGSNFSIENYRDLREAGLLGLTVPREYGGLGADPMTYALCLMEIARGCPATALTFNMHANVIAIFIAGLATDEQKRRYFGEVVEKGCLFASITSEPESSARHKFVLRTSFAPVDGGYRVSGIKHFCSLGDAADYYLVSGLLEGRDTAREGLLSALIPRTNSGIKVERLWNATGMRGTASHTIGYDTLAPQSDVIGAPGQLLTLDWSGFALGYAATYLGIAQAAFDFIVQYAKNRVLAPADEPISHHPLTQRSIGEMATSLRAATLLLVEAALVKASGDRPAITLSVNQAKYLPAELGTSVTEKAMRLAGGSGILKSLPLERWHRDALAGPVSRQPTTDAWRLSGKSSVAFRLPRWSFSKSSRLTGSHLRLGERVNDSANNRPAPIGAWPVPVP
jgi:alkylation response protein AidB-like acyl-CoA dehydrogenase